MSKHTPGPWKIVGGGRDGMMERALHIEGETRKDDTICSLGSGLVHYANAKANARLIAAAPDLLKTVLRLIALDSTDYDAGEFMDEYNSVVLSARQTLERM